MFRTILVAIDGTRQSNRALAAAVALAKNQDATLHILHVIDELVMTAMFDPTGVGVGEYVHETLERMGRAGRKIIGDAEKAARKELSNVEAAMVSSRGRAVADIIVRHAKRAGADLIVLGTHGRRGIGRLLMGSDAESVLRQTTVPVLLVRSPDIKRKRKAKSPSVTPRRTARAEQRTLAAGAG
jgi:nucleotide-binding universal stress UspA family protein